MLTIKPKFVGAVGAVFLSSSPIYSVKPFCEAQDNAEIRFPQHSPPRRTETSRTRTTSEVSEERRIETGGKISRETTSTTTTSVTERTSVTQANSAEGEQQQSSYGHNSESLRPYQTGPETQND
ncbi:MAG: hypothetical protein ACRCYZ_06680 [Alphaproteobacteria bacterium]